jgi:hypothetical protein
MKQTLNELAEQNLQKCDPTILNAMLESCAATEKFLTHEDPIVRCGALQLLISRWGLKEHNEQALLVLAKQDPNEGARSLAVACLGHLCQKTRSPQIRQFLANIVRNESEVLIVRENAYVSLSNLAPKSFSRVEAIVINGFPQGVDWGFVDSFRKSSL